MAPIELRKRLADTKGKSFRLRAEGLAQGSHSGGHRANRKGAGVEFAGHRQYVAGDDLRRLDRHALLRHGRLLIREFHTDTERPIHLIVDITRSMNFSGMEKTSSENDDETKASRALLLAATLAFMAKNNGDALGLTIISEGDVDTLLPKIGRETLEAVLSRLEELDQTQGPKSPSRSEPPWKSALHFLGGHLSRGSIIFVLSDFFDFSSETNSVLSALCTRGRTVRAAQILTNTEIDFPFVGSLRLQDLETDREVETDADSVRAAYQKELESRFTNLKRALNTHGGSLIRSVTQSSMEDSLRLLSEGIESRSTSKEERPT